MIQVGRLRRVHLRAKSRPPVVERLEARNLNLLFLPDLHSLDLFQGQPVPRSIIYPSGRWTRVSGDPLRNFDGAARIHLFGNTRRPEAVTTNSFQNAASLRPFLNQLQHTTTIQASRFNRFAILAKGRSWFHTAPHRYDPEQVVGFFISMRRFICWMVSAFAVFPDVLQVCRRGENLRR